MPTKRSSSILATPLNEQPVIGIVAGEASGDLLGAGLIKAIKAQRPDIRFIGIGGPKMEAEGFESLFPMERLAVMGITEVLGRLPELIKIRRRVASYFADYRPLVFIGIDAPDFNLDLEQSLHRCGVKTIHYVSPSVWAWRQDRIHKIKQSVNHVLTLLPFEADFYRKHNVPVTFVGHPLADEIPLEVDQTAARQALGFEVGGEEGARRPMLAVLPGSRKSEIEYIAPEFIKTMSALYAERPEIEFCIPSVNRRREHQVQQLVKKHTVGRVGLKSLITGREELPIHYTIGNARDVMAAAEAVLLASGTATLEAMLLKKPMVAAYKWGTLTHAIISRMVKSPYVTLPNLLANELLVPELVQSDCAPEQLLPAVKKALSDATAVKLVPRFVELHKLLNRGANQLAAEAVLSVVGGR